MTERGIEIDNTYMEKESGRENKVRKSERKRERRERREREKARHI
jgi:hypothetical protein